MLNISMMNPDELKKLIGNRTVFLWGASIVGFGVCRAVERNGINPGGFIDSSKRLKGKSSLGYKVYLPDEILPDTAEHRNKFIIITSGHYENEIGNICIKAGLAENIDFISARAISPLDPSVDISGICNLHCISCPRGNMRYRPPAGFMCIETYNKVLEKILEELPFVGNIQLYAWGEPLINPDVARIIDATVKRHVLCAISTNLNIRTDLSAVIKAKPDWIKVSVSGYGKEYERTHTGGNWELFFKNIHKLKHLKEEFNPDMYVEVNYHLYRHNIEDQYKKMKDLCENLGFIFRPNPAYLYSLDNLLDYREGRSLTPEAMETLDMLLLTIDDGIAIAEQQKHLPCAEERCFPINWNLNVRFCGAYFKPVLIDNFLETPLSEIVEKRNASTFCDKCKSYALHRFTSVYIQEKTLNHTDAK
jgi:MoaA/NifB/PqqE/SkfB family radical SAM enzyme